MGAADSSSVDKRLKSLSEEFRGDGLTGDSFVIFVDKLLKLFFWRIEPSNWKMEQTNVTTDLTSSTSWFLRRISKFFYFFYFLIWCGMCLWLFFSECRDVTEPQSKTNLWCFMPSWWIFKGTDYQRNNNSVNSPPCWWKVQWHFWSFATKAFF